MRHRQQLFIIAIGFSVLLLASCGDQKDGRLSDADIAYLKMQRLQAVYGSTTTTTTATSVVTITSATTATVTSSTTTVY